MNSVRLTQENTLECSLAHIAKQISKEFAGTAILAFGQPGKTGIDK